MERTIVNQSHKNHSAPVHRRPLPDNVKMTGFDIGTSSLHAGSSLRQGCVFDGRYLWVASSAVSTSERTEVMPLTRVDVLTGEHAFFPADEGLNGNTGMGRFDPCFGGAFDGASLWFQLYNEGILARVDPATGSMTGLPIGNVAHNDYVMSLDGENNVWIAAPGQLSVLDPGDGSFSKTGITYSTSTPNGLLFDGESLWMIMGHGGSFYRIDPATRELCGSYLTGSALAGAGFVGSAIMGMAYADGALWFSFQGTRAVAKFDIASEEITVFSMENGVNGNTNMQSSSGFFVHVMSFDGSYIWMSPTSGERLVRIDPQTGSMRGYNLQGEDIGAWNTSNGQAADICFDGRNLWLVGNHTDRLLRVSPGDGDGYGVAVSCEDEAGALLRPAFLRWVDAGEDLLLIAPIVEGHRCTGYLLDADELRGGASVSLTDIRSNHTVVFVYSPGEDGGELYTVIQRYQDESGADLRNSVAAQVAAGEAFHGAALSISGYACLGHRVDGGGLQPSENVAIEKVQANHTVVYVYASDESGGECGDGRRCCCTKLEIRLTTCADNALVRNLCTLIQNQKGGCC